MFSKQRNNYVLVERPSTSPTAATSTPSVPADDGKFCLETPTTNFYQYTYNFVQSFAVCNRNDDNSCDARLHNCVFFHPGTTSTEYSDDHISALEQLLGDILRSNAILPSCSDVIFRSGVMFANFSFELM